MKIMFPPPMDILCRNNPEFCQCTVGPTGTTCKPPDPLAPPPTDIPSAIELEKLNQDFQSLKLSARKVDRFVQIASFYEAKGYPVLQIQALNIAVVASLRKGQLHQEAAIILIEALEARDLSDIAADIAGYIVEQLQQQEQEIATNRKHIGELQSGILKKLNRL